MTLKPYTVIWRPDYADYPCRYDWVDAVDKRAACEEARKLDAADCELPYDSNDIWDLYAVLDGHITEAVE
jgi:hypothetical protein